MSWQETSPGHWSRPPEVMERFHYQWFERGGPSNREQWTITICAKLEFPSSRDPVAELRKAWTTFRYVHPEIACVVQDGRKSYTVPDAAALRDWQNETFHIETETRSADELFPQLRSNRYAACHWIPASGELVIRSSHWRVDGRGGLNLLDEFLSLLAEPRDVTFGDEPARLAPSVDVVLNGSETVTDGLRQEAEAFLAPFVNGPPSAGMPQPPDRSPGGTRRVEVSLSKPVTRAVIANCKAKGMSVTTAVHAALAQVVGKHTQLAAARHYTTWVTHDLRKYCPPPYNSKRHAVSTYHHAIPVSVDPQSDFATLAAQYRSVYGCSLTSPDLNFMRMRIPFVERMIALFQVPSEPPDTAPELSSFGIIDDYVKDRYGDVGVRNFWLGVDTLIPQWSMYVWTWNGELCVSSCFNEELYDPGFVEAQLLILRGILLENLGIES